MRTFLKMLLSVLLFGGGIKGAQPRLPSSAELETIAGYQVPNEVVIEKWDAADPPRVDAPVYSVTVPQFDPAFLKNLAAHFGITGAVKQIDTSRGGAPGFIIEQGNPANAQSGGSLAFYSGNGGIAYYANDDGYRYDKVNRKPSPHGVPEAEEARDKALALLPALKLSTNDLQVREDGTVAWSSSADTTKYMDRVLLLPVSVVTRRHVVFNQRIDGGRVGSNGGGGQLRMTFVSDGKLSMIELTFRKGRVVGTARSRTRGQIVSDLKARKAFTWYGSVPDQVTVTNCSVVYPQANGLSAQSFLWPFYDLRGFGIIEGHEKAVRLYVPLLQ